MISLAARLSLWGAAVALPEVPSRLLLSAAAALDDTCDVFPEEGQE